MRVLPTLLMTILLAATSTAVHSEKAASVAADRAKLESLIPVWEKALEDLRVPGLAISVVRGDEVLLSRGFGEREVERGLPADADTIFYIASSTKSFVAMAVQILAEEGKIDLDSPVTRYLPRFRLASEEATQAVTVRDLLSHRQGLRHDAITQAEAYTGLIDEELFYRLLAGVEPTGQFEYTNLHFTLLGRLIEAVSGKPWQRFVEARILEPAGMERSTTSATRMFGDPNAALPTIEIDGAWRSTMVRKTDRTMHAAGGMGSTSNDLAQWLRLNLGDGSIDGRRILSADGLREMQAPQTEVGKNFFIFGREHYGLGWYVGTYAGTTMIHHFGSYVASRAHVSFLPEHQLGVAVMMNSSDPTMFVVDWMAATVYSNLAGLEGPDILPRLAQMMEKRRGGNLEKSAALGPNPAQSQDGLSLATERYAGRYRNEDWGSLEFQLDEGSLICSWGSLRPELHSTGADTLIFSPTPGELIEARFEVDERGVSALLVTLEDQAVRFEHLPADPG